MASHGRYTILGKLADGGMAEIFLALQHGAEGFEKSVVLKRILTQYSADPQFRNMLLDEAHISMSLQHGNVVQVLDLGVAAGRYFLALELVDGWDLEKVLQRAHAAAMVWPTALGLYVVAEVCRGLAYAHGKARDGKPLGIVHRDISPNNVLLSGEGEVKVADFGIAKAQRKREQTAAGVIKGKVAYMSPEQAQGSPVDRRSDIFSVGSLLYRTMTDRLPFEANNDLESLMRVQKAEFAPPRDVKPALQDSVSGIILRAMRLAPSERYQSADEMLADVERVLRTEFQSAGQTELKAWLVQLARRDGALPIGKQRRDDSGTVKDVMGTDLSAGTSFELGDLDSSAGHTEAARPSAPDFKGAPRGDAKPEPPKGGSTAEIAKPSKTSAGRRRSGGFWLGVTLALGGVVGFHYLSGWAQKRGVMRALGLGNDAAVERTPAVPAAGASPAAPAPQAQHAAEKPAAVVAAPTAMTASPSPKPLAVVDGAAEPTASAGVPVDADTHPQLAEGKAAPTAKKAAEPDDDEPDEEALLRDAVPDAEDAVIGEDDAEASAAAKPKPAGKSRKAAAKAEADAPRVETAVLHFTSAPSGAVVRTKARVLGRTPINLHFKTGNTYEVLLIKHGFEPATRKVSVHSTKDRKVAVTLKKRPPPKKLPFFHPHR
ncbi:MAG TPA: serine/threonine-protein kinase [Polyangia bacterium]|nr:serine/threonine-protein kinase [Polyangia bacterium]